LLYSKAFMIPSAMFIGSQLPGVEENQLIL
jgi:hypothetical protein